MPMRMFNNYRNNLRLLEGFEDRSCSLATAQDGSYKIVVEGGMEFSTNESLHQELTSIFGPAQHLQVKNLLRRLKIERLLASPDPIS